MAHCYRGPSIQCDDPASDMGEWSRVLNALRPGGPSSYKATHPRLVRLTSNTDI